MMQAVLENEDYNIYCFMAGYFLFIAKKSSRTTFIYKKVSYVLK